MKVDKNIFNWFGLKVPKRVLFFVAASVWTFAGFMLLYKSTGMIVGSQLEMGVKIVLSIVLGVIFYKKMFIKISSKHIARLHNLPNERHCFFSFFSLKSYLLMVLMITMGITLRSTGIVPIRYLFILYLTMSIPLLASAYRFFIAGVKFRQSNVGSL